MWFLATFTIIARSSCGSGVNAAATDGSHHGLITASTSRLWEHPTTGTGTSKSTISYLAAHGPTSLLSRLWNNQHLYDASSTVSLTAPSI